MPNRTWKETALAVPGVGVSMLPKVICPVCSPAYAAVLSSLGLGFLVSTTYLLPVTVAFLAVAVGALAFRASSRRGLRPFWIGMIAASSVVAGKFWLDSATMTYTGVGLLVLASVWNVIRVARTSAHAFQQTPAQRVKEFEK
jgi:mercuric ion transport protein